MLLDLKADHSNFPDQEPVTITGADIQERVKYEELDMIHTNWLKKLTALYESLGAQMNTLLMDGTHPDWSTQGWTV